MIEPIRVLAPWEALLVLGNETFRRLSALLTIRAEIFDNFLPARHLAVLEPVSGEFRSVRSPLPIVRLVRNSEIENRL